MLCAYFSADALVNSLGRPLCGCPRSNSLTGEASSGSVLWSFLLSCFRGTLCDVLYDMACPLYWNPLKMPGAWLPLQLSLGLEENLGSAGYPRDCPLSSPSFLVSSRQPPILSLLWEAAIGISLHIYPQSSGDSCQHVRFSPVLSQG